MTNSVWSQDFGQTCYKGNHLALALGLGLPSVLLMAIGGWRIKHAAWNWEHGPDSAGLCKQPGASEWEGHV